MAASYAGLPNPINLAREQATANRVNVKGPGGTGTWTPGKNGGPATYTTTQNPALSQAQKQTDITYRRGTQGAANVLANPTINTNKLAAMPVNAGTTGQEAIMRRLSPQIDRERNALHTQLTNWGLQPGTETYDEAMARQGERENDLLSQAALQGINLDMRAREQGLNEQVTALNTPADILNKMEGRTSAPPTAPGGGVAGSAPDLLGAWTAMNNANRANANDSRQNTMDWLNLGVQGLEALPDVKDWMQEMGWWP